MQTPCACAEHWVLDGRGQEIVAALRGNTRGARVLELTNAYTSSEGSVVVQRKGWVIGDVAVVH